MVPPSLTRACLTILLCHSQLNRGDKKVRRLIYIVEQGQCSGNVDRMDSRVTLHDPEINESFVRA